VIAVAIGGWMLGAVAGPTAQASTDDLFHCAADYGFVIGRCAVTPASLAVAPAWEGEGYEADFAVTYSFRCAGHVPDIGAASGDAYRRFVLGAEHAVLHLTGRSELRTWDPDPTRTLDLAFSPGCRLDVESVASTPSAQALAGWLRDAQRQGRIIDLALDRYLLAQDFAGYRDWDLERTQSLLDSVQEKAAAFGVDCVSGAASACSAQLHLQALANALERKIAQTPALPDPDELGEEQATLVGIYRQDLEEEVSAGERMARRLRGFGRDIDAELAAALARAGD
jgi:hypothetical protein